MSRAGHPAPRRWIRLAAIAVGALVLASCRALPQPAAAGARPAPHAPVPVAAAAADRPAFRPAGPAPGSRVAVDGAVVPVAHRVPSPAPRGDVQHAVQAASFAAADCRTGRCPPGPRGRGMMEAVGGGCGPAGCPPLAVAPCEPPPPVVGPWYVCDGGDHGAPARPVGEAGLANLTAGDTVARYRPADDGPANDCVQLATTNCACVYAPRFAAVREVIRLAEDAADQGPNGLALDRLVGQQVDLLPVRDKTQQIAPAGARNVMPGVALEERLGPLAVDQTDQLHQDDGRERAAAEIADLQPEAARRAETPRLKVSFVVPVAWTCVKAANVLVGGQEARVVAADRGTATLRFECPGRAELTLCKRAGTDTARPGEELDFMIYFLNSGDRPLTDIVLADARPARLELVPDSAASSVPADITTEAGDDGSVVLTWRLTETLQPGQSGFVRFRTTVR
jgi:uncharacterized repeat protein (TIGR01451 family)